jgi:phosphoserine phosphatase RsbX
MTRDPQRDRPLVECGSAGAGLDGGESGDVHAVVPFDHGVLVALIDGLGHGVEAAVAANEAARVLRERAGEPLPELLQACHEALRRTRGAVMSLACFDGRRSSMAWAGVGNVEGFLLRASGAAQPPRESIGLRGGVIGFQLPSLRASVLPVSAGDTLVLATDGIRSGFAADLDARGTPQQIAEAIFRRHARGSDDALVVVARYLGDPA